MSKGTWSSARRSAWVAYRDAFRWRSALTVCLLTLRLVEAVFPACQVLVISGLVRAVEAGTDAHSQILAVTLVAGGFLPLQGVIDTLQSRLQLALRTSYENEIVDLLAQMSPAQRTDAKVADAVQGAVEAIPFNLAWQATSTISVVQALTTSLMLGVSVLPIDTVAAACVLLALIPALVTHSVVARTENDLWPLQASASRRAEYFVDQLRYARSGQELATLGASHQMARWAKAQNNTVLGHWMQLSRVKMRASMVSGLLSLLLLGAAISAIVWHAHAPAGAVAGAILGVLSGMLATRGAGSAFGEFIASAPLVNRYDSLRHELRADARPFVELPGPHALAAAPAVGCTAAIFGYRKEVKVLDGIDVTALPGQITAFVGANGAGKTTLLRLLRGELQPSSGEVHAAPTALTAGMNQDFQKYELTVREFLSLGRQAEPGDHDLWRALAQAQAKSFVAGLPGGLDTQLGEQWDGVDLSGGQWQRLALARTFLDPARVWVLDEPTSAVDAQSEREIFDQLKTLGADRTILLVSHRAWTLRSADVIYVIEGGRVVQNGSFPQLMSVDGPFTRMFQEQNLDSPAPELQRR